MRKSAAPNRIACTAWSIVPNPVVMITSAGSRRFCTSSSSCRPSTRGILKSVTITLYDRSVRRLERIAAIGGRINREIRSRSPERPALAYGPFRCPRRSGRVASPRTVGPGGARLACISLGSAEAAWLPVKGCLLCLVLAARLHVAMRTPIYYTCAGRDRQPIASPTRYARPQTLPLIDGFSESNSLPRLLARGLLTRRTLAESETRWLVTLADSSSVR